MENSDTISSNRAECRRWLRSARVCWGDERTRRDTWFVCRVSTAQVFGTARPARRSRHIAGLEHDPEKWRPVCPWDKREAFARRSCSNWKMTDEHDSTQLKHALGALAQQEFENVRA